MASVMLRSSATAKKRGFVSALLGAIAILSLLFIIALQWSVSAQEQATIASYSAKLVRDRNVDALQFYNHSQIDAEFNSAYQECGCGLNTYTSIGLRLNTLGVSYVGNVSGPLSDPTITVNASNVTTAQIGPITSCSTSYFSQFNYTVTVNSSRAAIIDNVSQTDNVTITQPVVGSSNLVNITIYQGTPPANHVASVTVNCSA